MKNLTLSLALATLAMPAVAMAHNGNRVHLTIENGVLVTGLNAYQNGDNITPHVRVFEAEFGEDPTVPPNLPIPNLTQFPGFDGADVSGLGALTFNILDVAKYWDGNGPVVFGDTGGETIAVSKGKAISSATANPNVPGTRDLDSTDFTPPETYSGPFVPGFTLTTPAAVDWHTHPNYLLLPDGNAARDDGVYLLKLEVSIGALTTDPFYVVFGQNAEHETIDAAVDYVNASLIPEPASLGLLALGSLTLLARRRR